VLYYLSNAPGPECTINCRVKPQIKPLIANLKRLVLEETLTIFYPRASLRVKKLSVEGKVVSLIIWQKG
jgi:hypothetical protein